MYFFTIKLILTRVYTKITKYTIVGCFRNIKECHSDWHWQGTFWKLSPSKYWKMAFQYSLSYVIVRYFLNQKSLTTINKINNNSTICKIWRLWQFSIVQVTVSLYLAQSWCYHCQITKENVVHRSFNKILEIVC